MHTALAQSQLVALLHPAGKWGGRAGRGCAPDVVRLALVEGGHEAPQLRAELGAHAVELEGRALAPPRLSPCLRRLHQQLPEPQGQLFVVVVIVVLQYTFAPSQV